MCLTGLPRWHYFAITITFREEKSRRQEEEEEEEEKKKEEKREKNMSTKTEFYFVIIIFNKLTSQNGFSYCSTFCAFICYFSNWCAAVSVFTVRAQEVEI